MIYFLMSPLNLSMKCWKALSCILSSVDAACMKAIDVDEIMEAILIAGPSTADPSSALAGCRHFTPPSRGKELSPPRLKYRGFHSFSFTIKKEGKESVMVRIGL